MAVATTACHQPRPQLQATTPTTNPKATELMLASELTSSGPQALQIMTGEDAWRPDLSVVGCAEQSGFSVSQAFC